MMLISELNTIGICTCHLTRYVQRYTVLSLNPICSCHLTSVVGKLFIAAQITFSIAIEPPLHLKPLEQNELLLNNNIIRLYNKMACN